MQGKLEWTLYFGHLMVPILLAVDILVAWHINSDDLSRPPSDKAILAVCILWVATAIALAFLPRHKSIFCKRTAFTIIWCIYGCLGISELAMRVFDPLTKAGAALRPPGTKTVFRPSEIGIPVVGLSSFSVNEIGLRGGPEPSNRKVYKIITLGSSTTEDETQDDSREWSHLLMQDLNERQSSVQIWIANAGVSGYTTVENLAEMKDLPVFARANAIILVLGQTDMSATLVAGGAPTQPDLDRSAAILHRSMLAHGTPIFDHPYYKRLRLYTSGKQLVALTLQHFGKEQIVDTGVPLSFWREQRAKARILPLPNLSVGIEEYRERLNKLSDQCNRLKIRCILATQPTLWRSTLSRDDQALLWGGRMAPWNRRSDVAAYASAGDLEAAMDTWNHTLMDFCLEKNLECFDLASRVPKTTQNFYDDSHTTDQGARQYAEELAEYLLSKPPFHVAERTPREPLANSQPVADPSLVAEH